MSLFNQLTTPIVRSAPVTVQVEENGALVPKQITVRFKSLSIRQLREKKAALQKRLDAGETMFISETLKDKVVEFVEADGSVTTATEELLETMEIPNLKAIETAIDEYVAPK